MIEPKLEKNDNRRHPGIGSARFREHIGSDVGTPSSLLIRYTEKKFPDSPNVLMEQVAKLFPHRRGAPPFQDMEIRRNALPAGGSRIGYRSQIKPPDQNPVGSTETTHYNLQPTGHKPGSYPAVRVNVLCRPEKAFHAGLPVRESNKESSNHGRCRVQHIRNQQIGKQGEGDV